MRRIMHLSAAAVVLLAGFVSASPAAAAEYPGGRRTYAVAQGSLPAAGRSGGPIWVRLAMYYFFADGTVSLSYFDWNRTQAIGSVNSGYTSAGCDNCPVHTAARFQRGTESRVFAGTYAVAGDLLTVTWSADSRETWRVSQPAPDLSRLDLVSSTLGVTVGWGFGSNASNDAYVPVGSIPRHSYTGRHAGVDLAGTGRAGPSIIPLGNFTRCNANCLSWLSPPSTACSACPGSATSSPIRYYMAGTGRRNHYEHWCTCLRPGQCYTGGSHRKPQLQVIGDTGTFHGWVGVEASNFTANSGFFAVHYHVDV
jgi:hypothetical protein